MIYKYVYVLLVMFFVTIFSCTVDITGAPCNPEKNNCPSGQYCSEEGICKLGSPEMKDVMQIKDVNEVKDISEFDIKEEDILEIVDVEEITDAITDITINKCYKDEDCRSDAGRFICIDGKCVSGDCHSNSDCKTAGYPTCGDDHFCNTSCDNTKDCGTGYVCCQNMCKPGTCCENSDCGPNMRCVNNICTNQCEKNEDCESNKCCDNGLCANKFRGCCVNTDCETSSFGFSCINYICSCTSDYECPSNMICDKNSNPPVCKVGCSDIHKCQNGYICCNGKCIKGECCNSEDCTRAGYPTCANVNGSYICIDECNPQDSDPCNSLDNKSRCCKQDDNIFKCVIANCCNNGDCKEPDKPYCDTLIDTPNCVNRCDPASNINCGTDYICCSLGSYNMCFKGDCCSDNDCNSNYMCIGHKCVSEDCTENQGICQSDQKCCSSGQLKGLCYTGECCEDNMCKDNQIGHKCILSDYKCGCETNSDCNSGYICKDGKCIKGDCLFDSDCIDQTKPICINNYCTACTADLQCQNAQKGDICCNGVCRHGQCCASVDPSLPDCENYITKPICKEGICSSCSNSTECKNENLGTKCCMSGVFAGDCYDGECCSSYDCIDLGYANKPICHTSDRKCYPCNNDNECKNEFSSNLYRCCSVNGSSQSGSCYVGECCDDSQCSTNVEKKICNLDNYKCVQCLSNSDCGIIGYICCNNQCIKGECCNSNECIRESKGDYCYQYHCRKQCQDNRDCSSSSIYGTCCNNITTSPFPFCTSTTLGNGNCCITNGDCGSRTQKCCYGICILDTLPCD